MKISPLNKKVTDCIKKRGFKELSPVQKMAVPVIISNKNLLLIAPTGTGKTESAMIPVFNEMLNIQSSGFCTLYVTPLRALNRDILKRMKWWCDELGISIGVRHGDTTQSERRKQALSPPELLVTTPETIQAMFMGKRLREHFKQVRFVIIDEIHDLAGTKRGAQLSIALERISSYAGEFQRIGLSATVGNPNEIGMFLCGKRKFEVVEVPVKKSLEIEVKITGERFEQQVSAVETEINNSDSSLIFVNTRVLAESLGYHLLKHGNVDVHHGSLSRDVRIEAEEKFKRGETKSLICTSSMELGIDIGHIDRVIQFGSPREVSRLVQRIGRAGHQIGKTSFGTIISTGFDDLLESLVIAQRAPKGLVEDVVPSTDAADVIANQIAAIAVEYGEIPFKKVRDIISASAVSSKLSLIDRVCEKMEDHYLVRRDGEMLITTSRARRYLSSNLSMIPDERKFWVLDMTSGKTVGSLDESFVVTYLHTGAVFITKGQLWRVLDMETGKITVEPAKQAKGELPSWEGEQIPVPFEIAQEVGSLRRNRNISDYTKNQIVIKYADAYFEMLEKNRSLIPTDQLITLEQTDEGVVLNVCGGHKVNETLGRVLSILISARFGGTVGIETDAYRIFLRLPKEVRANVIHETLTGLKPQHIKGILELAMKRSSLFKWKVVQIAKKFGAIDTDADYERISMQKLSEMFDGTPVQDEAFRELFTRYMDVEKASLIVNGINTGDIKTDIGNVSMIGAAGLFSSRDQIPPPTKDQAVLATIKHRISKQDMILVCMHCRSWKTKTTAGRAPEQPKCPKCGAGLIAAIKPYEAENYAIVRKKEKNTEEKEIEKRMLKNANIVLSSGKQAIIVLAAKGVGPDTASRILGTFKKGDAIYNEILKAERNYIKTHRFW